MDPRAVVPLAEERGRHLGARYYERDELQRALVVLSERFPPDFCRHYFETISKSGFAEGGSEKQLRRQRQQRGFEQMLLGLYGRRGVHMPMLALGVDLAQVAPLGPDQPWLDRFRNPHEIFGVEFELELWANCVRAGIPISRVLEGTTKTPELRAALARGRRRDRGEDARHERAGPRALRRVHLHPSLG